MAIAIVRKGLAAHLKIWHRPVSVSCAFFLSAEPWEPLQLLSKLTPATRMATKMQRNSLTGSLGMRLLLPTGDQCCLICALSECLWRLHALSHRTYVIESQDLRPVSTDFGLSYDCSVLSLGSLLVLPGNQPLPAAPMRRGTLQQARHTHGPTQNGRKA